MPLFPNLVKSFFSLKKTPPDHEVLEVPVSAFIQREVVQREECMVLYKSSPNQKQEIVLYNALESFSNAVAFSLTRVESLANAKRQFDALAKRIVPLSHCPDILRVDILTRICETLEQYPDWSASHIAAFLDLRQALCIPEVKRSINSVDIILGKSPLFVAIEKDNSKVVTLLLAEGADPKAIDRDGNTICHIAATSSYSVIKLVLNSMPELVNALNYSGQTPLHLACEKNNPEYVRQLLNAGADFGLTGNNTLPIHSAIKSNSTSCAQEIIKNHQSQLNVGDKTHGDTPLHWARSREMIAALIELGCSVNTTNQKAQTALHKMAPKGELELVLELITNGASVNDQDLDGNTPLHYANSLAVLQCLLVFRANINIVNQDDESPLHIISTSDYEEKHQMIYSLHAIGANRCSQKTDACGTGCSPDGDYVGISPHPEVKFRERHNFDHFLDQICLGQVKDRVGANVLCLDGGGIKGLVLIQILQELSRYTPNNVPVSSFFHWIGGTSTGGVMALALAVGKRLSDCRLLYFRLKKLVFNGARPYPNEPMEQILKQEFGETKKMSEITGVKVFVTAVKADKTPADLHLFRNYRSGRSMYHETIGNPDQDSEVEEPDYFVWEAARASSAAPTYFKAYKGFVDGGLVSNNPTLDMITEVFEYTSAHSSLYETPPFNVQNVLSVGVGKPPAEKTECPDVKDLFSLTNILTNFSGVQSVVKLLVDQATMCDNQTVDRARAWCSMCGINFLRLTPQLHKDVELNETDDGVLIDILWQTMAYCYEKRAQIQNFIEKLAAQQ